MIVFKCEACGRRTATLQHGQPRCRQCGAALETASQVRMSIFNTAAGEYRDELSGQSRVLREDDLAVDPSRLLA